MCLETDELVVSELVSEFLVIEMAGEFLVIEISYAYNYDHSYIQEHDFKLCSSNLLS